LRELCLELGSWMLVLGKKAASVKDAKITLESSLKDGTAWEKFIEFIAAQGGDAGRLEKQELDLSSFQLVYQAEKAGIIQTIDARKIGIAAMLLGAGRETKESEIDYGAGIYLLKKGGERVEAGEPLLQLFSSSKEKIEKAMPLVTEAIIIGDIELFSHSDVPTVIHNIRT